MRRTALAAGFIVSVGTLLVLILVRYNGARGEAENYAFCVERGFAIEAGPPSKCTDAVGRVFYSDGRTMYLHDSLPFSFSYPAALSREEGAWPRIDQLTGSGVTLEILAAQSVSPKDIFSTLLPEASSGSFSIIRARIDSSHLVTAVVPLAGRKESAAVAIIPLHPPVSYRRRLIENIALRGTPSLVQAAIDSLAFIPVQTKVPRLFLP